MCALRPTLVTAASDRKSVGRVCGSHSSLAPTARSDVERVEGSVSSSAPKKTRSFSSSRPTSLERKGALHSLPHMRSQKCETRHQWSAYIPSAFSPSFDREHEIMSKPTPRTDTGQWCADVLLSSPVSSERPPAALARGFLHGYCTDATVWFYGSTVCGICSIVARFVPTLVQKQRACDGTSRLPRFVRPREGICTSCSRLLCALERISIEQ